jgi:hypothetical protein
MLAAYTLLVFVHLVIHFVIVQNLPKNGSGLYCNAAIADMIVKENINSFHYLKVLHNPIFWTPILFLAKINNFG